jgi:hypothetical protein
MSTRWLESSSTIKCFKVKEKGKKGESIYDRTEKQNVLKWKKGKRREEGKDE